MNILKKPLIFSGADEGIVPCQIIFCLKEESQNKINSHRWALQAFAPILLPHICVLLDAGVAPGNDSIYHLWKAFDTNSDVAGACGEIVAIGEKEHGLLNPLVAAQNFEYKLKSILDKPRESVFGLVSMSPGGFSAYRYNALLNDHLGQGPMSSYFVGEMIETRAHKDLFAANMYLAGEDILGFELVTKRKAAWRLLYVRSAYAEILVPRNVADWIYQRQQRLNGSFFASVFAITHAHAILRTDHAVWRALMFLIELLYQALSLVLRWFALVLS